MKKAFLPLALLSVVAAILLIGCGKTSSSGEDSSFAGLSSSAKDTPVSYWNGTTAFFFEEGIGTSDSPYIISSAEELAYLSEQVNRGETYPGQYFSLEADIVLNEITDSGEFAAEPYQWTPIGTKSHPFDGFFNGNYHTITGMYIDVDTEETGECCLGLFGYISNARVSNICVAQSLISFYNAQHEDVCAGMIVGKTSASPGNTTYVDYCQAVDGTIVGIGTDDGVHIGGIVGYAYGRVGKGRSESGDTYVSTCCANRVTLDAALDEGLAGSAGGIVGKAQDVRISDCVFSGSVTIGRNNSGGIAGECRDAVISNSCSLCVDWVGLNENTSGHRGAIVSNCCDSTVISCFYAQGDIREAVGSLTDVLRQSSVSGNSAIPFYTIADPEWLYEQFPAFVDDGNGQPCLPGFLSGGLE